MYVTVRHNKQIPLYDVSAQVTEAGANNTQSNADANAATETRVVL